MHVSKRMAGVMTATMLALAAPAIAPADATPTWHHVPPRGYPEARGTGEMVFDEARGEMVMFGGRGLNRLSDETWVWNGAHWTQRKPAHSPPARRYFSMVYDRARAEVVLFGGEGANNSSLADTWVWDGADWHQRTPVTSPSRRARHAMAWDQVSGGVILFGGVAPSTPSLTGYSAVADTWLWDGSTWTQKLAPATPGPRFDHAMTYDAARNEVVLFGGVASYASIVGPSLHGTWIWNGTTWVNRRPDACPDLVQGGGLPVVQCATPKPRETFDMVYDAAREVVVLFGGGGGFHKDDTWTWDGLLWTMVEPARRPPPQYGGAMAYDSIRRRVVLFGGHTSFGWSDDTWVWDGSDWAQPVLSPLPTNRWDPAMAYDPIRREVVIFGGLKNSVGRLSDTWVWDGIRWTQRSTSVAPPARENAAFGFHPATGRLVLFGGVVKTASGIQIMNDTWEWDGSSWREVFPATIPPQRTGSAIALHESSGRLVMFGGWAGAQRIDDMWEWTGSDWRELIPYRGSQGGLSPSYRNGHVMSYDPARDAVLLHDGIGAPPDTWAWTGTWTKLSPVTSPPDRDQAVLTYGGDSTMVLFGGIENVTVRGSTYIWNGSKWSEHFSARGPAQRRAHRAVWDAARGVSVMFGGDDSLEQFNDTWVWAAMPPADTNRYPTATVAAGAEGAGVMTLALGASDPDGSIASWSLDIDYDGSADYKGSGPPPQTLTHAFSPGTHNARLEVTDDYGDARAAVTTFRV